MHGAGTMTPEYGSDVVQHRMQYLCIQRESLKGKMSKILALCCSTAALMRSGVLVDDRQRINPPEKQICRPDSK